MSQISQSEWNAFLTAYYQRAWGLAWDCLPEFVQNHEDAFAALAATFEKLAAPAVYLKEEDYATWKQGQGPESKGDALRKQLVEGKALKPSEIGFTDQPTTTKWRPTRNKAIQWCPESEADPKDVDKAKANVGGLWAMTNEQGQVSIFRKVTT